MKTALILVDVINDFFHPEGVNYHPEYELTLVNILKLLEVARVLGAPVVHAMESHRPFGNDFEWAKLPRHSIAGEFAAQPAQGVNPDPQKEYVVHKRRYSGFFQTDLDLLLREEGVRRVVIVGVKTHVCVRATVQDAFAYGYEVLLPPPAVNSNHLHLHEASLEDIQRYMGRVVSMEEAQEALTGK